MLGSELQMLGRFCEGLPNVPQISSSWILRKRKSFIYYLLFGKTTEPLETLISPTLFVDRFCIFGGFGF